MMVFLFAATGDTRPAEPSPQWGNFTVVCPDNPDGFLLFIPHPTDCTKYFVCLGVIPVLMSCAPPLYYDPSIQNCNWPDEVDCTQHETQTTTENVETTTEITETTTEITETTTEIKETTTEYAETTNEDTERLLKMLKPLLKIL